MDIEFYAEDESSFEDAVIPVLEGLTFGQVRQAIADGAAVLNGKRASRGTRVFPGDLISIASEALPSARIAPVARALDVLFEDDWLIAVDKPAGVPVVPGRHADVWEFMGMLAWHAKDCPLCPPGVRFRVVHRLDRDTSGAVILAKTAEAERSLSGSFARRAVGKRYLALVAGEAVGDEGAVNVPIGVSKKRGRLMAVTRDGKESLTEWRVLERFKSFALVEARPKTGRTHQIRVHLAHAGMPLAVDALYGASEALYLSRIKRNYRASGEEKPLIDRLTLHCAALEFDHPVTHGRVKIEAPPPEDFRRALKALRKYARGGIMPP